MNREYSWREGMPRPKVEASVFGAEVEAIDREKGGVIPEDIVEHARSPNSPLHPAFEWDDAKAGDNWRREQAGAYLRGLVVTRVKVGEAGIGERAWFPVREGAERRYAPTPRIMGATDLRNQVITQAASELDSYITRFMRVLALSKAGKPLQEAAAALRDEAAQVAESAVAPKPAKRQRQPAADEARAVA